MQKRRYNMRKFDYSFLDNGLLPAKLINLTASISSLKTMSGVRKKEYTKVFTELEAVAKVQSVKSSNAMEGIVTSDERIAAIVNQNSAPLNHNEAEIAGYRDALNEVHLNHMYLDFRETDILRLHEMIMSIVGYEYGGQYKTDDNVILEIDADGNRRVRFRPTPAIETKQTMEQLELAYMEARNNMNINQLLLIPCVILETAGCLACCLYFCFIKTAMMQVNMYLLKNRSIIIKRGIMKLCVNRQKAGQKVKTVIFRLLRISCLSYICAIRN